MGLDGHLSFWKAPHLDDIHSYIEEMKPHPDLLEEAMSEIGSENAVMVGDSASDVKAAENSGKDSVYINRDGKKNDEATYNIESLKDLKQVIQ